MSMRVFLSDWSERRALLLLISVVSSVGFTGANLARAEDTNVFIFSETVSPNGKYALAWTKAGLVEPADMPYPDDPDGGVQNWLMELDSHKLTLLLPKAAYWELPGGIHTNHYNMETVWSDDGSRLLVLIDSRRTTDQVFLVNTKEAHAHNFTKSMQHGFDQVLRRSRGAAYRDQPENYDMMFSNPWFTARDAVEVFGDAFIGGKTTEFHDFEYYLTFSIESGSFSLQKSAALSEVFEESSDRQLNRVYRTLIGLLPPSEHEALVQEERAWIGQRDATKGSEAKESLTKARIEELTNRKDKRISALEADGQKPKEE
jgi:hypothetical protein